MVEHFEHRASAVDGQLQRSVQRRQRLAGDVHHRAVHLRDATDRDSSWFYSNDILRMRYHIQRHL